MAEGQQPTDRKATMGEVKRLVRRRIRRRPEHEEQSLNIYPMMDMMTILLVFMVMQFAATQANLVQSAELQIPYSTANIEPSQSTTVTISSTSILVEGKGALQLRNGLVDPSQKQGGGNGFLITPLLNRLQEHRDALKVLAQRNPQRPFRGEVQIVADRRTPYRTLIEVVYTCGQAEFKNLRFVVLKGHR